MNSQLHLAFESTDAKFFGFLDIGNELKETIAGYSRQRPSGTYIRCAECAILGSAAGSVDCQGSDDLCAPSKKLPHTRSVADNHHPADQPELAGVLLFCSSKYSRSAHTISPDSGNNYAGNLCREGLLKMDLWQNGHTHLVKAPWVA